MGKNQTGHDIQERAFATATWPHYGNKFLLTNLQIDILKRNDGLSRRGVELMTDTLGQHLDFGILDGFPRWTKTFRYRWR